MEGVCTMPDAQHAHRHPCMRIKNTGSYKTNAGAHVRVMTWPQHALPQDASHAPVQLMHESSEGKPKAAATAPLPLQSRLEHALLPALPLLSPSPVRADEQRAPPARVRVP